MRVFYWDGGLKLTKADLAIDFRRRQPRAFISHAHSDHMARHQYALCTPATAAIYQHRLGKRPVREMPYREPIDWGGLRLTTYPAGHCLGSAMLLAEDGDQRLLYTGDFKLARPVSCEPAELPEADILVIESTYGRPEYCLPPREEVLGELYAKIRETLELDAVPVVEAYALGKAQEITRLLTAQGFAVVQHKTIHAISQIYEAFGVDLGPYGVHSDRSEPLAVGVVLVAPPRTRLDTARRLVRFAVTGWAQDPATKYRLRVDHAIPLSDHADYNDLLAAVARVNPRKVYTTHGPDSFVDRLREAGFDAHPLGRASQGRLF